MVRLVRRRVYTSVGCATTVLMYKDVPAHIKLLPTVELPPITGQPILYQFLNARGLYTTRWLGNSTLETKINTVVILSIAAATLSMLVIATTGIATIFAQQNYGLFNAQLAQLYPHNVFNAKLAGSNEVPPVTTAASGTATFQLLPTRNATYRDDTWPNKCEAHTANKIEYCRYFHVLWSYIDDQFLS